MRVIVREVKEIKEVNEVKEKRAAGLTVIEDACILVEHRKRVTRDL
jgi:predicted CoA-binding protein